MKSWNKVVTIGSLAGIAGGLLCTGCGKNDATSVKDPSGVATTPAQTAGPTRWSHKGTEFKAVTVLAKKHKFFGKPGVMVTFCNEDVASGRSTLGKNCVEVFFPAQDSGYGKPISVAFRKGTETVQQNSGNGYNGRLTATGSTLSGELNINKIGYDEDCSITGSFEATLTDQ